MAHIYAKKKSLTPSVGNWNSDSLAAQ